MKWLFSLITGSLGGFYGYLVAFGLGASLAVGATYYIVHNANAAAIARLEVDAATQKATDATASLGQLQGFINGMHIAEANYQSTLDAIAANTKAASLGWKNATAAKPLPKDCLPDANRLRSVNDAIRATNAANSATVH